jgi:hypothetical protein
MEDERGSGGSSTSSCAEGEDGSDEGGARVCEGEEEKGR